MMLEIAAIMLAQAGVQCTADREALEQVIAALYDTLVGDDEEMPGRAKLGSRVSSYLNVHFGRKPPEN